MIGTLVSFCLAAFMWLYPNFDSPNFETVQKAGMLIVAFGCLSMLFLSFLFAYHPLQKAEQHLTPRVIALFQNDFTSHLALGWTILFSLVTFTIGSGFIQLPLSFNREFFPFWILLFGISIDVLLYFFKKILSYLNPFHIVNIFAKEAKKSIQQDKELDLCESIDALAEIGIKGIDQQNTSICHEVLEQENELIKLFLSASKSIAHKSQDTQTKALGITDKVSYTLFYLYQRLDILFNKALEKHLEPTCSTIITLFGKIALHAAKYDVSLAGVPLRFIGKCGRLAQKEGLEESVTTAFCVFLEVARQMGSEIDLTYYEIKDPFLSIINGMEVLSKESFKQDKTINISLLMQPFKDLRHVFEKDPLQKHQDTPIILQNIDRILGEYEALLVVMKTMPPIPQIDENEK